jgi:hypothetical protein
MYYVTIVVLYFRVPHVRMSDGEISYSAFSQRGENDFSILFESQLAILCHYHPVIVANGQVINFVYWYTACFNCLLWK